MKIRILVAALLVATISAFTLIPKAHAALLNLNILGQSDSAVTVTVVGTISGTLSYTTAAVAGVLLPNTPLIVEFSVAIPGSAINTAIVVTCPALGAGNTNSTVVAHGYQL